jgi:GNAT superfamily N-acetyltransferase
MERAMGLPISIRLDDDVREELETQAQSRGIGLATLLREIATQTARDARRKRIREDSERVARYVASAPEANTFYRDWGTPRAKLD